MKTRIGLEEATASTLTNVPRLESEVLALPDLVGRVLAENVVARVDSPSVTASLKDGYAVVSEDLCGAGPEHPVRLELIGRVTAGGHCPDEARAGSAIRITTGAALPGGTQAVLAEEFCHEEDGSVVCMATAEPGRNILERGTDIRAGEPVVTAGQFLDPGRLGLLASAGVSEAAVIKRPRVAVIATGDEVIAPGRELKPGKLYASNLVEVGAWLSALGMEHTADVVPDEAELIRDTVLSRIGSVDAVLTSGGAWTGEKDFLIRVFEELNWRGFYHRVRMGPGKGIAFGLLQGKPVFCLPGGPPSNEMAFLQLALPGLLAMQGRKTPLFPRRKARLSRTVRGQADWTQFIHARFEGGDDLPGVVPARLSSRLQSMAFKEALIVIPEGTSELQAGSIIEIQDLRHPVW